MTTTEERLRAICEGWGGRLIELPEEEYRQDQQIQEAPFSAGDLGIRWAAKEIVFTRRLPLEPVEIIHEMGHVFAATGRPDEIQEFDFLGWEYVLALEVGISRRDWVHENQHYAVTDDGDELGYMGYGEVTTLLDERIRVATAAGLIREGKPVAIR